MKGCERLGNANETEYTENKIPGKLFKLKISE